MSGEKNRAEAQRWLTAQGDLDTARILLENGRWAHACFHAQQAGEKALKALWYNRDLDPWGHSVLRLIDELRTACPSAHEILRDLLEAAGRLDRYHVPTRYPNGLHDIKAILEAYKFQPRLEKRHEQLKSVQNLAPVWLKNVSRVEALLFLYFIALLVHALLEREVRQGMVREGLECLPLYPEERECKAPRTERLLDVFALLQRHRLFRAGQEIQRFEPELSELHRQILDLMRLPYDVFRSRS
jgi:HEPN domain-containing protein